LRSALSLTSLWRLKSASRCFNRGFSSSTCPNRRASLTSSPAYLLFQL
jgi:hypothetical protein